MAEHANVGYEQQHMQHADMITLSNVRASLQTVVRKQYQHFEHSRHWT